MQQQTMIGSKVEAILSKIQQAKTKFNIKHEVRLVAVSKTKTVQQIKDAYDVGIRHFGQNYVDQIQEKAPKLPEDIKWHFIGHLQSNKIKKVIVPNLEYLQTVDRQRYFYAQQAWLRNQKKSCRNRTGQNIRIIMYLEIESAKNGASAEELDSLYTYIAEKCPHMIFKGLMTIGKQGDLQAFNIMNKLKGDMCQKYKLSADEFELSMGMSGDFQSAIEHHSTSVRVGSSIFGQRNYNKK